VGKGKCRKWIGMKGGGEVGVTWGRLLPEAEGDGCPCVYRLLGS